VIRFWLSRNTAVPIYEQLKSQIILGILSQRLKPGQKLPSVRELARRLKIHPNTVSAGYGTLADEGWVEQRRGSGVFVRPQRSSVSPMDADAFARSCFAQGLARGYPPEALRDAFARCANVGHERLIVVDPDLELARVLAREIGEATGREVPFVDWQNAHSYLPEASCVLITERFARSNPALLRSKLTRLIPLKSAQDVFEGHDRPSRPILLSVVSCSETILRWARILLSALGFPPDSLLFRNVREEGWREGLLACHVVAADLICRRELPSQKNVIEFRIVASDFPKQLSPVFPSEDPPSRNSVDGRSTSG
jgi:DNA-binding transcriptional regulator YhcF (GntR family)